MALTTKEEQLDKTLAIRRKEIEISKYQEETSQQVDTLKSDEGFDACMTEWRRIEELTNDLINSRKVGLDALELELKNSKEELYNSDK